MDGADDSGDGPVGLIGDQWIQSGSYGGNGCQKGENLNVGGAFFGSKLPSHELCIRKVVGCEILSIFGNGEVGSRIVFGRHVDGYCRERRN